MENNSPGEGQMTKAIENQTAKIPSVVYLSAAIASIALSVTFKVMGKKHDALFVGQWVAPFLLLGIYNKIVKTEGSE
ncbi:hypothetical protein [Mucilaginibacter ginkgonis]|uniref:Uncharacterized protein n=1 Tax=Mucilaginibacter ginkgonis TaxID=2682091 RepID=A0A6I4HX03_9SPHI|nr:hypothetical protein [Mucilaginibacter ginkgonis]QQL51244.1 hypothetical protein GO620_007290 [Mucilaginibacter ginkgonis]